ncbi:hypothetical protein [Parendozoicomonas sp. Alg238-R29]|uniref:hypothetical protein n=1 Tax=Parendozoicomonas sp. Alg238-R29 TaxID=2993446 RepID=UPI00248E4EC9|nr:hypothetical protein [Parendozoicomonas sp. Alg238-R29]
MKETIAPDHAEAVKEFISQSEDSDLQFTNMKVHFLKGGVKNVKDKHLLIYRYQLV